MYTSDHKTAAAEYLKRARTYLILTIACCLIGAVYEHFSFGVYSYFMLYAFAVPMVCGVLPALFLASSRQPSEIPRWSIKLWDAGIAVWTVGAFFRGILEIYGTTNRLIVVYPVAGVLLLAAGLAAFVLPAIAARRMYRRSRGLYPQ